MVRGSVVSTTAADCCAALLGIFSIVWIIILAVPVGWHRTTVFGVLRFDTGLYSVTVSRDILGHMVSLVLPDSKLKTVYDKISDDTHGLQEMRDRMCLVPSNYCDDWAKLAGASIMMLLVGCVNVVLHWVAAGLIGYFFHVDGTKMGNQIVRVLLIIIPTILGFTLLLYFFLTVSFGDSNAGIHYGPSFFIAVLSCLIAFVPVAVFEMCVIPQSNKVITARADIKAAREFEGTYGGGSARQSLDPYGQGPQVQMQNFGGPQYGGPPGPPSYGGPPPGYGGQPGYGGPPPAYGGQPGYGGAPQYGGAPPGGYRY